MSHFSAEVLKVVQFVIHTRIFVFYFAKNKNVSLF